jgi:hypothetical protein
MASRHHLNKNSRKITLTATGVGVLVIEYDGMAFHVTSVNGYIFFNNTKVNVGDVVPGCCVITFGVGAARKFVTFDVSNPEAMP